MSTPIKKRRGVDLIDDQKPFNTQNPFNTAFTHIRVGVQWGVGYAKNWRILTTRYRSDLGRIDTDIQATIGLQNLNEEFSGRRLTFDRIKIAVSGQSTAQSRAT